MFVTNGSAGATVLMLAVGVVAAAALAQPSIAGEGEAVPAQERGSKDALQGRFLEPAYFGVRSKKFTIGTGGIGTFFRAWRNCIEEGKSLATTESDEEQRAIERLVARQDTDYWIAATNLGSPLPGLTWVTSDLPVQTAPLNYYAASGTCVTIGPDGEWINNECLDADVVRPYICEEYF